MAVDVLDCKVWSRVYQLDSVIRSGIHYLPLSCSLGQIPDDLNSQIGGVFNHLDVVIREFFNELDATVHLREIDLLLSPPHAESQKSDGRRDRKRKQRVTLHTSTYAGDASSFTEKFRFDASDKGRSILRAPEAAVAQLDRASDYGSEGWGFESLRLRCLLSVSYNYLSWAEKFRPCTLLALLR